jgi:hypothetical protein
MSDNLFDNFLREKLQNHDSPVAEGMWERIQAKREKERRVGYWWKDYRSIGVAVVALVTISTLVIKQQLDNSPATITDSLKEQHAPASLPNTGDNKQLKDLTGSDKLSESERGNTASQETSLPKNQPLPQDQTGPENKLTQQTPSAEATLNRKLRVSMSINRKQLLRILRQIK